MLEVGDLLNSIEILEFNKSTAEKAAGIHAELMKSGNPVDILYILIAGIVIANNEELVTKDVGHFSRIPGLKFRSW